MAVVQAAKGSSAAELGDPRAKVPAPTPHRAPSAGAHRPLGARAEAAVRLSWGDPRAMSSCANASSGAVCRCAYGIRD